MNDLVALDSPEVVHSRCRRCHRRCYAFRISVSILRLFLLVFELDPPRLEGRLCEPSPARSRRDPMSL